MIRKILLCLLLTSLSASSVFSSVYYVAANGNNSNAGTINKPFLTIQRAQEAVMPGDTVYVRGGTYVMSEAQIADYGGVWAYVTHITKSGSEGKRINYWAYPSEKPVFDYTNVKPANKRVSAFWVSASWIHFKGLEVTGVQVTIKTHTQSECFSNNGSNNIYEMLSMHDGQAIGFFLREGSNNLILNCDAYRNHDSTSENGRGGNTDGFGNHPQKGSVNNVYKGCRAWFNSDDGYDCINASEATVFDHCWAFYNGYSTSFKSLGDGNGFKAGGYAYRPANEIATPIPRNTIMFCLSVNNKVNGFYSNHHRQGSDWYNNSAYMNATNYNMLNRLPDNSSDVPGFAHKMRNNLGFAARGAEVSNLDSSKSDVTSNYFNLPVTVTAIDFVSLDTALLTAPRQVDGSLPDNGFMRLKPNSKLIDKGEKVGFPYNGAAPDLGCFESGKAK
jgi:hypothetical protein